MKEVFLMVDNQFEDEDVATEVFEFNSLADVNYQLAIETYGELDDDALKIYHGVLTSAKFIPKDFDGCIPYIYIKNPYGKNKKEAATEAHFEKAPSDWESIALAIEELITEQTYEFDNGNIPVTIDDVWIFYGHELPKVLHVPEDHIDEELLDRITTLAESIEEHIAAVEEEQK